MTVYSCDVCESAHFATESVPEYCPFCGDADAVSAHEIDYATARA